MTRPNEFQRWICSREFYDLAQRYRFASLSHQPDVAERFEELKSEIIGAEKRFREPPPGAPAAPAGAPDDLLRALAPPRAALVLLALAVPLLAVLVVLVVLAWR